jgi:hypothetical protein
MVKILNVMDGLEHLKDLGDGKRESGFWRGPDRNCEIILVFSKDSEVSLYGGRILSVETRVDPSGKKRKIFTFEDDPTQRGIRRPDRFRPNGCYAFQQ